MCLRQKPSRTCRKNINLKVDKYISYPANFDLYFVVISDSLTDKDVEDGIVNMSKIDKIPGLKVVTPVTLTFTNRSLYTTR
jgi:hypothetical protein